MKIEDVALYKVTGAVGDTPGTFRGVSHSDQLDLYPDIAKNKDNLSERPAKPATSALYVEVQAENGLSGLFGPIQESQAYVIQSFLRPILIGEDAFATEVLLDKMMRLHRHGRSGIFMTGVSPSVRTAAHLVCVHSPGRFLERVGPCETQEPHPDPLSR